VLIHKVVICKVGSAARVVQAGGGEGRGETKRLHVGDGPFGAQRAGRSCE